MFSDAEVSSLACLLSAQVIRTAENVEYARHMPTCLSARLAACLPACLPAYLPTYVRAYVRTYVHTHQPPDQKDGREGWAYVHTCP